jgi:hypothetical protein
MTEQKLQQHIHNWLTKNHAPGEHVTILRKVLIVGKPSKSWVETIQRYVQDVAFQTPERGDIKRACRALLKNR